MNFLKKQHSVILFLVVICVTQTFINSVNIHRAISMMEDFEPVVIEYACPADPVEQDAVEGSVEDPVHERITCPLDDETQQMILDKCNEYEIDFAFAMAVIFKESSFRPDAVSYDESSIGLMQIHKINHKWLSETLGITDFFDPEQNVTAGLYMLRDLFEKYEDPPLVLMAYNMGEAGAKKLWTRAFLPLTMLKVFFSKQIYTTRKSLKGWV